MAKPNHDRPADEDAAPASEEVTAGNPYNLSRGGRLLFRLIAVTLAISMTALFLRGVFHL